MFDLLRNFDLLSFGLGIVTGILAWVLVNRLRPIWRDTLVTQRTYTQTTSQDRRQNDEIRLGNDTLRRVQTWHIAAPIFSLDEVIIPPRLLAPPMPPAAYEPTPSEDITDFVIPFMPDWPEMGSYYGAPWLDPPAALQASPRLAIVGQPGSGKTVALAHLATSIIRQDPQAGELQQLAPVALHVADLALPAANPQDLLAPIITALAAYTVSLPGKRLPALIHKIFNGGWVVLLLDGLDELAPAQMQPVMEYLHALLAAYPKLRVVVAAHPTQTGGLAALDFQILPLTSWGPAHRALFISRWSELWKTYIATDEQTAADPLMIIGWLLTTTEFLTPLELTLKVWAAFTGDALGPSSLAAMEAYLRRSLATQPNKTRKALEQMAAQMMLNAQGTVDFHTAGNWLGGADMAQVELDEDNPNQPAPGRGKGKGKLPEKARSRGSLPGLIESGVVQAHDERALRLVSPVLLGYLAAQGLAGARAGEQIAAQTEWSGKSSTLTYLACIDQDDGWLEAAIKDDKLDITLSGLLNAGRRLQTVPDGQPWIAGVLRQLAVALQKDRLPMALKARIITALALANANGINLLLRQLSSSPVPNLRQLAALGLGMMKDAKSLGDLLRLQQEPNPLVNRAAILALVAMGDKGGLEAVATQLLTGDDSERCAAAEALANHPEEGYPTLEEAADVSDPTVRRAAVFGLARTRQTWAIALLKKLRAEDTQWIVQDTANQMLTALEDSHPRQPHPLPELTQTAWLLAFAAERGLAVPPGRPAVEMLLRALKEGSDEQRQAAAYYLSRRPDAKAIAPLYQLYFSQGGDVHEYAWETLWSHAADGIPLPPPAQFDYR